MLIKLSNLTINNLKLQLKSRKVNKQAIYKSSPYFQLIVYMRPEIEHGDHLEVL
jgi:hypothetical protein